jgi:hypothetical protein
MQALARLRALSPRERALLAEALIGLGLASMAVALLPFRTLGRLAAHPLSAKPPSDERALITSVGWAVRAGARRVPFRAKCFDQGLAAWLMLRRRGINATLHYGVARERDNLIAHVWVTADDRDVIGCENKDGFAELVRFPAPSAD